MPKKMTNDPWELSSNDASKMKDSTKTGGGASTFCPKRNVSIGSVCKACETIQPLWDFPEGSPERKLASKKKATVSYFLSVVLPSNKDKSIVLEIGKKAGDYIIDSIYDPDKNWKMIAHPVVGKGFDTKIKKRKGDLGFNTYDTFRGEQCDWDIPKSVLESLTDLSQANIIKMLKDGTLVEGENYFRIQSLKLDETLTFRVCPAWNYRDGGKVILTPVFRHWGVSQAEIDGDIALSMNIEEVVVPETVTASDHQTESSMVKTDTPTVTEKHDTCYGIITPMVFYDVDDSDCNKCGDFVECGKIVTKKLAKANLR